MRLYNNGCFHYLSKGYTMTDDPLDEVIDVLREMVMLTYKYIKAHALFLPTASCVVTLKIVRYNNQQYCVYAIMSASITPYCFDLFYAH